MSENVPDVPEYNGPERRFQEPPSKIPKIISDYIVLWILGIVGSALWVAGIGYLDTRHVQRGEFMQFMYNTSEVRLLDKIDDATAEVQRLELYNRLGSQTNQPARDQVILQTNDRKEKWQRQLNSLQQARPSS